MTLLRAFAFNAYFFGLTTIMAIIGIGVRVFAPGAVLAYAKFWSRLVIQGAARICGIRAVITGWEHLPASGPLLLASQHQSAFDTLVWMTLLPAPSYVIKQELTRIPLFGPLLIGAGMIPVDRTAGASAMRGMLQATGHARDTGRQIIIFPEGTRLAPGERVKLQPGIAAMATRLEMPVYPVATDSGLRWGRRAFLKYRGPVHIAIGAPIAAGTPRAALLDGIESFWRSAERASYRPVGKSVEDVSPERGTAVKTTP